VLPFLVKMVDGEDHAQQVDHDPEHVQDIVPVGALEESEYSTRTLEESG
jgi:hypothetical protein